MNIRRALLLSFLPFSLVATSPIVSRYFPSLELPTSFTLAHIPSRPYCSVTSSAFHASRSSELVDLPREMYKFDGLMEMGGWYDLHEMVAAAKEAVPGFVSPFARETGGSTLAQRQLLFGAQSSLSLYSANIAVVVPVWSGVSVGANVPLWHAEARQKYQFPIMSSDTPMSAPQQEQTHRMRQLLHKDLGMVHKDWIVNSVGDISVWLESVKNWGYVWLLRTMQLGARLSVSMPTAKKEDTSYPSSFALGNRGAWGISLALKPAFEIKEAIWLRLPFLFAFQTTTVNEQRLPVYSEPMQFGVIKGLVKTRPGMTFSFDPSVTLEHFVDNLHVSFGFSFTKHYRDRLEDVRLNPSTPSYLTRSTLPADSLGAALPIADQYRAVRDQIMYKSEHTKWTRSYITLGAEYELRDFFPTRQYAPIFRLGLNYCIGQNHAAKMHQVSAGLAWRF